MRTRGRARIRRVVVSVSAAAAAVIVGVPGAANAGPPPPWEYAGTYPNYRACQEAGAWMYRHEPIERWTCTGENEDPIAYLWVVWY